MRFYLSYLLLFVLLCAALLSLAVMAVMGGR
jgi:hypothetical protein